MQKLGDPGDSKMIDPWSVFWGRALVCFFYWFMKSYCWIAS